MTTLKLSLNELAYMPRTYDVEVTEPYGNVSKYSDDDTAYGDHDVGWAHYTESLAETAAWLKRHWEANGRWGHYWEGHESDFSGI